MNANFQLRGRQVGYAEREMPTQGKGPGVNTPSPLPKSPHSMMQLTYNRSVHVGDKVSAHQHHRYSNEKDRQKNRHLASPFVVTLGSTTRQGPRGFPLNPATKQ